MSFDFRSGRALHFLVLTCLAAAIYFLYFFDLTAIGIAGTDEPRYAAIARSMAMSGDWVTPRLFGVGWYEKPALLYWMTAAGFRFHLSDDLAPRLPVALLSLTFLIFYYWILRRQFGPRVALFSSALLGSSAFWIAFSHAAVPDLPLAAFFSAAIFVALPWIDWGDAKPLPWAAVLIGLAVLAKALVPLVLLLPVFWFARKHLADLFRPRVLFTFVAVAFPWYLACYARNGMPFIQTLFVEHQFGRMTSEALQHVQPFWFYLAVLPGAIFPWVFLLPLLFDRELYRDVRARYLLATVLFGLLFFSAAPNKLPGYILPLLPALFVLFGLRLARTAFLGELMMASSLLLVFVPAAALMLPKAMAKGIGQAWPPDLPAAANAMLWFPNLVLAGGAAIFCARRWRPEGAVLIPVLIVAYAVYFVETRSASAVDSALSARGRVVSCIPAGTNRAMRYGLNYYAGTIVPDCRVP